MASPPDPSTSGSLFQRCKATYINGMKNCTDFKGRMSSAEYWRFLVCNWVITVIVAIPTGGVGAAIYFPLSILPIASATIRRFNDFKIRKDGFK